MTRLLVILALSSFSILADAIDVSTQLEIQNQKSAQRIAQELSNGKLRAHTQSVLNYIVKRANYQLTLQGYGTLARRYQYEWNTWFSHALLSDNARGIGDFAPLLDWLALYYELLELKLGKELCDLLHLSDIKVLNFTIPVVFSPCAPIFKESDFYDHFVGDGQYYGFAPVVAYWLTNIGCMAVTLGTGVVLVCGTASTGVEIAMHGMVAPALSPKIYRLACGEL